MRVVNLRSKAGVRGRLRLARDSRNEPSPGSVHLVVDDAVETVCGLFEPHQLTRLDRPWSAWSREYRCARCDALHPSD
jgi:hypothetical protein